MNVIINGNNLLLVLSEDDDAGYVMRVLPEVTNIVSEHEVEYP